VLILAIGDVVGKPGRRAVMALLPGFRRQYGIDLVIANGENVAGGLGLTSTTAEALFDAGVDVLTSGNHIWAQKEIIPYLDGDMPILRPLNYPPNVPGRGYLISSEVMVVNLIGRAFMSSYDCPFRAMDQLLAKVKNKPPIIIVDFHAEATSEKIALGRYLDGRVSAVLGTHTHVGTIDTHGDDVDSVLGHFLTMLPHHLLVGKGRSVFNGVLVEVDDSNGRAVSIGRICEEVD